MRHSIFAPRRARLYGGPELPKRRSARLRRLVFKALPSSLSTPFSSGMLAFVLAVLGGILAPPLQAQIGSEVSPTHRAAAESLVSRFDMPEAWLNYRQFRFSQQHPKAPGAFFMTLETGLAALGEGMADSLALLYTQHMDEQQILQALAFVRSPLGTRYNHFRRDGLWARTRPSWFWEAARALHRSAKADSSVLATGVQRDMAWRRFGRHFVEFPDHMEVKRRLQGEGEVRHGRLYWEQLRELALDSAAGRIGLVARDFLGAPERDSLLRVFATSWGRYLDPFQRPLELQHTTRDYRRRVDQRVRQRWRVYEYRALRYPMRDETREFRGQKLHFAFIGESPGGPDAEVDAQQAAALEAGGANDALDWRYEGLAWIVEAPGAKSDKDLARLERWLQDMRFSPEGEHRIYFVRKPIALPQTTERHPDGSLVACSPKQLEAHMLTLPPKKRRWVVGLYHVVDGSGSWQAFPLGR